MTSQNTSMFVPAPFWLVGGNATLITLDNYQIDNVPDHSLT